MGNAHRPQGPGKCNRKHTAERAAANFFVVAAWCFSRSSPRLERWVLTLPHIGPMVRDYRAGLGMPRRAKLIAISMIVVFVTLSVVVFIGAWPLRLAVLVSVSGSNLQALIDASAGGGEFRVVAVGADREGAQRVGQLDLAAATGLGGLHHPEDRRVEHVAADSDDVGADQRGAYSAGQPGRVQLQEMT